MSSTSAAAVAAKAAAAAAAAAGSSTNGGAKDANGVKNGEYKPLLDFTSLPPAVLDAYISYYDLAPNYPPPMSPPDGSGSRSPSPSSSTGGRDRSASPGRRRRPRRSPTAPVVETTTVSLSSTRKRVIPVSELEGAGGGAAGGANTSLDGDAAKEGEIPCPSHFPDPSAANAYLGAVAARHFAAQPPPKEGEAVVGFLYRCRTKDKVLKIA